MPMRRTKMSVAVVMLLCLAPRAGADPSLSAWLVEPVVVPSDGSTGVSVRVRVDASVTSVAFEPASGAPARNLSRVTASDWALELSGAEAVGGYQADDVNRNFAGFVVPTDGAGASSRYSLFVNVADAEVRPVAVTDLAPGVRCSGHVLNVLLPGGDDLAGATWEEKRAAIRRAYAIVPDDFDFLNVVSSLPSPRGNRNYEGVRNDVSGIGMTTFDNSGMFGSAGRLQGIVNFPIDTLYDAASPDASHELGHRWINFLNHPLLASAVPHWPYSDMGRGLMGYSVAGGEGLHFPFALVPQGPGSYLVEPAPETYAFTPLDLYLMGLLEAEAVDPFVVLTPVSPSDVVAGAVVPGVSMTVDDVMAVEGVRVPSSGTSQRAFRVGTMILSRTRLLTDYELALFERFAVRARATSPLAFAQGFAKGTGLPFTLATRGLATLTSGDICPTAASDLPDPIAELVGTETYAVPGEGLYDRYMLSVTNRSSYSADMFADAPDLPPCGVNTSASRTWVDVYSANGVRMYGFCDLASPDDLAKLWFAVPAGTAPPAGVYLKLHDRGLNRTWVSNVVAIPAVAELSASLHRLMYTLDYVVDPGAFRNREMRATLSRKIGSVLELIRQDLYAEAHDKLVHDIGARTNGCATSGAPDMNDWIRDCASQNTVHPLVQDAIARVAPML